MTSQSSTTKKKRTGFMALCSFSARRFWTTALLFGIVLFFILPVPVMMTISDRAPLDANDIYRLRETFSEDWISVIRYFVIVALSVFGVVTSCARFSYLKNKVSVDFYHSLPVKRGQLFLTQLLVSAVAIIIPYLLNMLITVIIFGMNDLITKALVIELLIMSAEAFIYSVTFFSLSTLVGMISGLTAVHLTLTVIATFIIPAIYLATLAFVNIFNDSMWFDFYVQAKFFEGTSPALRLMLNDNPLSIFEASVFLLISVAMLTLAFAVYMRRKSERSGTPIVFPMLGEVVKYVLVYLGALGFGLFFYFAMDSLFWCVFGIICGTVLVFMLTNTILEKTARSMFKGIKGLGVFAAVGTVCFILLCCNAFGINTRVPSPNFTSRIVANIDGESGMMEFRDKDVIAALHTLYTQSNKDGGYYAVPYSSSIYSHAVIEVEYTKSYYEDPIRLEIVFYPKIGLPIAKSVYIYNKSDFVNELRVLLDSEEFAKQYSAALENISGSGYVNVNATSYKYSEADGKIYSYRASTPSWHFSDYSTDAVSARKIGIDIVKNANNRQVSFDFFQQQAFGSMYIRSDYTDGMISGYYGQSVRYPLLSSMTDLVNHYVANGTLNQSPDELNKGLAECIDKLVIYKYVGGQEKELIVTDKDQILEALRCAASPVGNYTSAFTLTDMSYRISYDITVTEASDYQYYYDEDGNETVVVEDKDVSQIYEYTDNNGFYFILGRIPDFVIEYFRD